jgi:hypothetical protein
MILELKCSLENMLFILGILSVSYLAGCSMYLAIEGHSSEEIAKFHKKLFLNKVVIISFSLMFLLVVLIPSKEDVKFIIGGGLMWKGVTSISDIEGISELPENLVSAANVYLEQISSLEKDTNKE